MLKSLMSFIFLIGYIPIKKGTRFVSSSLEDNERGKKLSVIAISYVQWKPVGQPSIKVIVQMLEGSVELTLPADPLTSHTE